MEGPRPPARPGSSVSLDFQPDPEHGGAALGHPGASWRPAAARAATSGAGDGGAICLASKGRGSAFPECRNHGAGIPAIAPDGSRGWRSDDRGDERPRGACAARGAGCERCPPVLGAADRGGAGGPGAGCRAWRRLRGGGHFGAGRGLRAGGPAGDLRAAGVAAGFPAARGAGGPAWPGAAGGAVAPGTGTGPCRMDLANGAVAGGGRSGPGGRFPIGVRVDGRSTWPAPRHSCRDQVRAPRGQTTAAGRGGRERPMTRQRSPGGIVGTTPFPVQCPGSTPVGRGCLNEGGPCADGAGGHLSIAPSERARRMSWRVRP
ncbi:MAG: hypothetical protein OZSIB_3091 [Candidatus Ozemobacter sibiricus]|uniref:Uncharacterized protein n=1 Tax=Candidatus Ozemobacter sibiricus TaxID=2268124 RepID=A0A367ZGP1_9BACT|nr:MAG: hypothetical protein OZSIB_3091 [Candidatus Ozemobacter sibiricus]